MAQSVAKEFPTPLNGLNIFWICFDKKKERMKKFINVKASEA